MKIEGDILQNKRRHKRFKLDFVELDGQMFLSDSVEILSMSSGGVSLKTDRRLIKGKDYLITLEEKGKSLPVKGKVVRSALSGTEERSTGERVTTYTARMKFDDGQTDKIADFLDSLEQKKKAEAPAAVDRRLTVRFHITIPLNTILSHSAQFKMKNISLSGMLIQSEQSLEINSMIPMGLSLDTDNKVNFNGRVASCRMTAGRGQAQYEIGVEFSDLTDKDRALLNTFIDYLAGIAEGEKAGK